MYIRCNLVNNCFDFRQLALYFIVLLYMREQFILCYVWAASKWWYRLWNCSSSDSAVLRPLQNTSVQERKTTEKLWMDIACFSRTVCSRRYYPYNLTSNFSMDRLQRVSLRYAQNG